MMKVDPKHSDVTIIFFQGLRSCLEMDERGPSVSLVNISIQSLYRTHYIQYHLTFCVIFYRHCNRGRVQEIFTLKRGNNVM